MTTTPQAEREWWDEHAAPEDTFDVSRWRDGTVECLKAIEPVLPDSGWVLDLGCGMGRLSHPVLRRFPNLRVLGLDISKRMLDLNYTTDGRGNRITQPGLRLVHGDGRTIPRPDFSFMAAYSVAVFQHLAPGAVQGYLEEVHRTLMDGARFRFQVVTGPTGGDAFDYRYSVADLSRWAEAVGLHVEAVDDGLVFPEWTWLTVSKPAPRT